MKRPELLLLALVAVVALAGMYGPTGAKVLVIQGETPTHFDRPLGNKQFSLVGNNYQCFQNAEGENVCCYEEAGKWECMGGGDTFGPAPEFREGGEKGLAETSRGMYLG